MSRVQHTHSTESKYKAVQLYLEHGFGYKRVAIPEASIRRWVKFYENEDMSELEEKREKSKGTNKGRPRKNPLSPEEELIRLRAENKYLKKLWALQRGKQTTSRIAQYIVIERLAIAGYRISVLCRIAQVFRSGYYKWQRRRYTFSPKQLENHALEENRYRRPISASEAY